MTDKTALDTIKACVLALKLERDAGTARLLEEALAHIEARLSALPSILEGTFEVAAVTDEERKEMLRVFDAAMSKWEGAIFYMPREVEDWQAWGKIKALLLASPVAKNTTVVAENITPKKVSPQRIMDWLWKQYPAGPVTAIAKRAADIHLFLKSEGIEVTP